MLTSSVRSGTSVKLSVRVKELFHSVSLTEALLILLLELIDCCFEKILPCTGWPAWTAGLLLLLVLFVVLVDEPVTSVSMPVVRNKRKRCIMYSLILDWMVLISRALPPFSRLTSWKKATRSTAPGVSHTA